MQTNYDDIVTAARQLGPEDRARLIDELHETFTGPIDPEVETAWARECERRLDALDRGEAATMPIDEVIADVQTRLDRMRDATA